MSQNANSASKLKSLRAQMKTRGLAGYIIPRQDEFQGEYVGAYAERLRWLTGFAGSWGIAAVTLKSAVIFVDGRYTVQVRQQVDSKLFQPRHLMTEPLTDWIAKTFRKGDRIGFDPWLLTAHDARKYSSACNAIGAEFVVVTENLIDAIWNDQPERVTTPIVSHPHRFAGVNAKQKLTALQKLLRNKNAAAVVVADPTSVAWLLNIRSADVPYTPVPLCHAIVHRVGKTQLFAATTRFSAKTKADIQSTVKISAPQDFRSALRKLGHAKQTVIVDPLQVSEFVRHTLAAAGAKIIEHPDPCMLPKALKSKAEQAGARSAQLRDGIAVANFLCWLDNNSGNGKLTERSVADQLEVSRRANGKLIDLSFETISAAGGNAALPHYHVPEGSGSQLQRDAIFLIDSGGQYLDGTTDITRTVIIGKPTTEMKDRFTRVLKGMIAISTAAFPQGTTGAHLDALARNSLWKAGLDFDHGTGHGVGSFLSVHEGPARISKTGHHALHPGMIISNEPGYYKLNHYGIRIENLLLVIKAKGVPGADRAMLAFETLTLAPIDRRLISQKLLTREELNWLDSYHARVFNALKPKVEEGTVSWLRKVCAPVK